MRSNRASRTPYTDRVNVQTAAPPTAPPAIRSDSAIDAESMKVLERMAGAHRAAKSFSCRITARASTGEREEFSSATLRMQRPFRLEFIVGEGERRRSIVANGKERRIQRDGRTTTIRDVPPGRAISDALRASEFFMSPIFPLLAGAPDAFERILPGRAVRLGRGNDETLDGVRTMCVVADVETPSGTARLTFSVGREDGLLRRLRIQARRGGSTMDLSELYTDIVVDGPMGEFPFGPDSSPTTIPSPRPARVAPPKGKSR